MKILVTGGAGYIGSQLVKRLVENENDVVIFDDLSTGRKESIPGNVELIHGDITKTEDIKKVGRVDAVYHLAAQVSVPRSIEDPSGTSITNITGTINVLNENKDSVFVFVSSASVYGNAPVPVSEEAPLDPLSPYGMSKVCSEEFCKLYEKLYGMKIAIVRPFNVYGPGQAFNPYSGVITKLIEHAKRGESLIIHGDGNQTRDFIHLEDIINAFILVLGKKGVYNAGSGKPTKINELANLVKKFSKKEIKIEYAKEEKGQIRHSYADISRISKLGFKPTISFEQGIKELMGE